MPFNMRTSYDKPITPTAYKNSRVDQKLDSILILIYTMRDISNVNIIGKN